LETGQIFDASKEEPIKFKLGEGRVIKGNIWKSNHFTNEPVMMVNILFFSGWDKGIFGMCVGYGNNIAYAFHSLFRLNSIE
jgi:FKBP-type peptidyl-prolyl cis-trans isomerase